MLRPQNIPPLNYEDDYLDKGMPPRIPSADVPLAHDSDRYNGALMRRDPQMSRLLAAFRFLSPEQRDELAVIAEGMRKPSNLEVG